MTPVQKVKPHLRIGRKEMGFGVGHGSGNCMKQLN